MLVKLECMMASLACRATDLVISLLFKPAFYSVSEGDFLQIVLQTNSSFDVPFTINVTIVEGTAVGKCLVHIFHNTQYIHCRYNTYYIWLHTWTYICSGKEVPIHTHMLVHYYTALVLDEEWQKTPSIVC